MENVFVRIIEGANLKNKEAMELFHCSEAELKQIKKGTLKPNAEGVYAICNGLDFEKGGEHT